MALYILITESIPFELDTALAVVDSTTMFGGNPCHRYSFDRNFSSSRLGDNRGVGPTSYFSVKRIFLGIRRDNGITPVHRQTRNLGRKCSGRGIWLLVQSALFRRQFINVLVESRRKW